MCVSSECDHVLDDTNFIRQGLSIKGNQLAVVVVCVCFLKLRFLTALNVTLLTSSRKHLDYGYR